jgi:DNA-binding NarL/FixJ family response regulator
MSSIFRSAPTEITIAIVQEDTLTREATIALLAKQPGLYVVASADDAGDASICDAVPDIVLIDARQQDAGTSLDFPALLRTAACARLVAMGVSTNQEQLADLIRVGVSGFVLRDASFADLVSTIRGVASGRRVLPPCLLETLVQNLTTAGGQRAADGFAAFHRMTPHQREIVLLIANGKTNKEIAAHKNISTNTAKTHVHNIMMRLSMHTRLQIAALANRERWTLGTAG